MGQMTMSKDQILRLREETGAGIMDCKRAFADAKGDVEKAKKILRDKGIATAQKKGSREAKEGQVISYIHAGGKIGVLLEVGCETDFVARNDVFQRFARDVAMQVAAQTEELPLLDQKFIKDPAKTIRDYMTETVARLGENIVIRHFIRFRVGEEPTLTRL